MRLQRCIYCDNLPSLSKVENEYKYSCDISCDNPYGVNGDWHTSKTNAMRSWNVRAFGKDEYSDNSVKPRLILNELSIRLMSEGKLYTDYPTGSKRHKILRDAGYDETCKGWNPSKEIKVTW